MLILFSSCLAAIAYVYFGYPLILWLGVLGRKQSFLAEAGVRRSA